MASGFLRTLATLGCGIVFGLGFVLSFGYWTTNFVEVQRAMASKSMSAARSAPIIGTFPKMFVPFIVVVPGMICAVLIPEMIEALKTMKEPTREALMDSVRNMKLKLPILLPGIDVETSGTKDGYPIEALQIMKFQGENWKLEGDVIQAPHSSG